MDDAKGLGAPLGVAEKTSDSGYLVSAKLRRLQIRRAQSLTTLFSLLFSLRVVRGVFPRSFPGVLNMSATFLWAYQHEIVAL